MPGTIVRLFEKGLWLAGHPDTIPAESLRRATGIHPIKDKSIQSRWGSILIQSTVGFAHSIFTFGGHHFYGVGTDLWRDHVLIKAGLSGNRLTFVVMPPTVGKPDVLFIAGGGTLIKVDLAGAVSQWGIDAPTTAPTPVQFTAPPNGFTQATNGAGVMTGIYKYLVTFYDAGTGEESIANPTEVTTASITNQKIRLSALPLGGAGVTARRIYRSKTGGTAFFYCGIVPDNATLTFDDNAADTALGAAMLTGVYQHRVTFLNTVTGSRSNAGPASTIMAAIDRTGSIYLTTIPVSLDPQVNAREIWRTVGNGSIFFKTGEILNNTATTFADTTADLDLEPDALPDDNDPPFDYFDDAAGPYFGRIFWTRIDLTGQKSRVYYSPVGRPEGVEDFIDVANDENPAQKVILWQNQAWVFTTTTLTQLIGQGPITPRAFPEVPGTRAPFSVRATPYGILYFTDGGVRAFDGALSALVSPEPMGRVFQEAIEGIGPFGQNTADPNFTGIVAGFEPKHDEYVVSDGVTTLCVRLTDGTWRHLPFAITAFHQDKSEQLPSPSIDLPDFLIGLRAGDVWHPEVAGITTDPGAPIFFEIQTGSLFTHSIQPGFCQFIQVEADTQGQLVTPTLILNEEERVLPPFATAGRETVEYAIALPYRTIGLRLTASLTQRLRIFTVSMDLYIPVQPSITPIPQVAAGAGA